MVGDPTPSPTKQTNGRRTLPPPHRLAAAALAGAAALLLADAAMSFLWHRPSLGFAADGQVLDHLNYAAMFESLWAGGGNLIAAILAGIAARLMYVDNPWGRTLAITVLTVFGFYRLTVLFDLLGDFVFNDGSSTTSAGIRLLLGLFILPTLIAVGGLLVSRTLTRHERHRALIGADDGAEPTQVRELSLLLIWYGIGWLAVGIGSFVSILLWTEYGEGGGPMVYAGTLIAGTMGCVGGLALGGCGLAYWFGHTRRIVWQATVGVASIQLAVSTAIFLWESVPRIRDAADLPDSVVLTVYHVAEIATAGHILILGLITALLWSPRLRRYFRSRT